MTSGRRRSWVHAGALCAALALAGAAAPALTSPPENASMPTIPSSHPPIVAAWPDLPPLRDKTLVAWVTIADLDQRGGSVLTIESADRFDALVFGERRPRCWMAGSEMFRRTQSDQSATPEETAGPNELVRVAAVYRGDRVILLRNDAVVASYTLSEPPLEVGSGAAVLIGLRHLARRGQPESCFAGEVDEARLYGRALTEEEVRSLHPGRPGPETPLGWWTFDDGTARDRAGRFPPGTLRDGAVIRDGRLVLDGRRAHMVTPHGVRYRTATHFRPAEGNAADPIPFFWKGEYHVFYLQGGVGPVPWKHIVSRDLVRWRELPDALVTDGAPDGPDGGHMFTGCVIEHAGMFHIFYTGHNPANPAGIEFVRHATSTDLVRWTKDPQFTLGPDGTRYSRAPGRNWRDPYVFWNEEERRWWMVVIASAPGEGDRPGPAVQGLLTSDDLVHWRHEPPLPGGRGEECPDLFRIGDTWYLIGGGRYVSASSVRGPYRAPRHDVIDFPGVYAGKRMFDGKRHVWVGWAWDGGNTDASVAQPGVLSWGGFLCTPRELYPGPDGELWCRPVGEAVARYRRTVLDLRRGPGDLAAPGWEQSAGGLVARAGAEPLRAPMPADALVELEARLDPGAEIAVAVREQSPGGPAYRFTVRPSDGRIALATPASEWSREPCAIDPAAPIRLRLFLDGSMLECFVNDAYAITRRVYDLDGGALAIAVKGGGATITALRVRTVR